MVKKVIWTVHERNDLKEEHRGGSRERDWEDEDRNYILLIPSDGPADVNIHTGESSTGFRWEEEGDETLFETVIGSEVLEGVVGGRFGHSCRDDR